MLHGPVLLTNAAIIVKNRSHMILLGLVVRLVMKGGVRVVTGQIIPSQTPGGMTGASSHLMIMLWEANTVLD